MFYDYRDNTTNIKCSNNSLLLSDLPGRSMHV